MTTDYRDLDTLETMEFAEWLVSMNLDRKSEAEIETYRRAWVAAIEFERLRTP
jgi:hypothetical protein